MIVPTYESTAKEQEILIFCLKKENKELKDKINKILTYIKDVDDATWDNTGPDDILDIIGDDDNETETH